MYSNANESDSDKPDETRTPADNLEVILKTKIMVLQRVFYVPVRENAYDLVYDKFKERLGLVHGKMDSNVLVWEDETGIGRYRIHFLKGQFVKRHKKCDFFDLGYWLNYRLIPELFLTDPLDSAIKLFLSLVKNPIEDKREFLASTYDTFKQDYDSYSEIKA